MSLLVLFGACDSQGGSPGTDAVAAGHDGTVSGTLQDAAHSVAQTSADASNGPVSQGDADGTMFDATCPTCDSGTPCDATGTCAVTECDAGACPGCSSAQDQAVLAGAIPIGQDLMSAVEVVELCALTRDGKPEAKDCLRSFTEDVLSMACSGCLSTWMDCAEECNCGSTDCTACVCATGCVPLYEQCAQIAHPVTCP